MAEIFGLDACAPKEIAARVNDVGVAKARLPLLTLALLGVLAGAFIGLAALMYTLVAIVFPITAFVAAGFEHSIANMYFFALAVLLGAPLGASDILHNLLPVIAGNIVGGSVRVAGVYWCVYLRPQA